MTAGTPLVLDRGVRRLQGGRVLLGGDPGRLLRLAADAPRVLGELAAGSATSAAALRFGEQLVDAGLAHPRPGPGSTDGVHVILPVRDRTAELRRCLSALGRGGAVLVVDDGSADPAAVARVCHDAGARVLHLPDNVGPAGARNAGLRATTSELVAFIDSDCVPPPGWLEQLCGHFADPNVAAVAPRIRPLPGKSGLLARFTATRGPLDLGEQEGRVRPGSRLPYVPTAALLVRRSALREREAFDHALRFGEDVDVVWRLHDTGWVVRYDPRTVVLHEEPDTWSTWLLRRHHYGTSAGPLAKRHGPRLTPLVLPPWPSAVWLLLLAGRPAAAAATATVPAWRLRRALGRAGLGAVDGTREALRITGTSVLSTATGTGGPGAVLTTPLLAVLLFRRRHRRAATAALVLPALVDWAQRRPHLDPVRWTALRVTEDLAYGAGVWRSSVRHRAWGALLPRWRRPT